MGTKIHQAARRARRKAGGLCTQCGSTPQKGMYCDDCLLASRLKKLRRAGLSEIEIEKARLAWAKFTGVCDACWEPAACGRWCFDHDHETLTFRGIVGENCNRALGMARDSVAVLLRLAKYLER